MAPNKQGSGIQINTFFTSTLYHGPLISFDYKDSSFICKGMSCNCKDVSLSCKEMSCLPDEETDPSQWPQRSAQSIRRRRMHVHTKACTHARTNEDMNGSTNE